MKKPNATLDFAHARALDLLRAYRRALRQAPGAIVMPDIFRRVANSPASRFWVSEERAAEVLALINAGRPPRRMRQNKREMFAEINRRVALLRRDDPALPLRDAVAAVIYQPAPRFYLTPRTVGELIYRFKKSPRRPPSP